MNRETFIPSVNLSLQLLVSRKPSSNSSSKTFNFHILGLKISLLPIHIAPNSWATESLHIPHKLWEPSDNDFNAGVAGNQALSWRFLSAMASCVCAYFKYVYLNWKFICLSVYLACWPLSFKWSWHSFIQKNVPPQAVPPQMSEVTKPQGLQTFSPP